LKILDSGFRRNDKPRLVQRFPTPETKTGRNPAKAGGFKLPQGNQHLTGIRGSRILQAVNLKDYPFSFFAPM